ncbi:MAG TPA: type 1 glutamine amidotransferase [Proteobacteria bacterium]|nr:type 1 glutamine amidotransferase [Pseudomonadota bacterium]
MRAHYFQHVAFEGPGSLAAGLTNSGFRLSKTEFFAASWTLPEPESIDFLAIMGGPMSVNDEHEHPWLIPEKQYLREFIATGKPVLGICLGAQLIASALGARIFPNPVREIGWLPIENYAPEQEGLFRFPPRLTVFHWHGETFTLPPQAVSLARSQACANQAFQIGSKVIGLQFHLETTPQAVRELLFNCRDELETGPYVQSEAEILAAAAERYQSINRVMENILAFLLKKST